MKISRNRGFTLIEITLVLIVGLGLIVGGLSYLNRTSAQTRYQERITSTLAILNEVKARDPKRNTEIASLHVQVREGRFGSLPPGVVESLGTMLVQAEGLNTGGSAMVLYLNYQDVQAANCSRLQVGMRDNGTGLFVGTIRDLGVRGVIRCSTMENGKTRGEIRIPYSNQNRYLAMKSGG